MNAIDVDRITKRFGRFLAVDRLSLSVPSGSVYGLLGPNGAGKTTTIRMILNIFYPDQGEIRIGGRKVDDAVKQTIGYLPEERGLYKKLQVGVHLEYLARLKGLSRSLARRRTSEFLERLELGPWRKKKVEELSKGMAQKVQFAAALIHDPSLVILDEPFAGLDPLNRQLLLDWIAELRERGVTIIFSTHQMDTVEELCESIALIHHGRMLIEGNLRQIKRRYGKSEVRLEVAGADGYRPRAPGVVSARLDEGIWRIQLEEGDDGQALLAEAMKQGRVEQFARVEPSLHDLFVRLVRESQKPEEEHQGAE